AVSLDAPAATAAALVTPAELPALVAATLLFVMTAVWLAVFEAAVIALDFASLQIVPVFELDALRTAPGPADPRASPSVTVWTLSLTSPSEPEIRTTPGRVAELPALGSTAAGPVAAFTPLSIWASAWTAWPLAALRGAERPDFGTGTRSIV